MGNLDVTKAVKREGHEGKYYKSNLISLAGGQWYLEFYPNHIKSGYINIVMALSALPSGVSSYTINRAVCLHETDTLSSREGRLFAKHNSIKGKASNMKWRAMSNKVKTESIANMTQFTIAVEITVVSVVDSNENDITKQYVVGGAAEEKRQTAQATDNENLNVLQSRVNKMMEMSKQNQVTQSQMNVKLAEISNLREQIEQLFATQSRVHQLTAQMNEIAETQKQIQLQLKNEQKQDDNDLQLQIDELTVSVHKLMSKDHKLDDSENGAFRNWVHNVLKLPEYLELFEENGVENLKVAAMLTVNELSMIGIKKIGHKMQILSAIETLKQRQGQPHAQEPAMEGGPTAYI